MINHMEIRRLVAKHGGGQNMCYCYTCCRYIKSLGIMSHRAAHRRREQYCIIRFSNGDMYEYKFAKRDDEL